MPYSMPMKKRTLGGGAASTPSGGGGSTAPAPASTGGSASAGPGYVNFSRLLSVNQGGAQKMADRMAGQVQQQGQAASTAIQNASQKVGNAAQSGTLQYEKATVQQGDEANPNAYREAGRVAGMMAGRGYQGPKDWAAAGVDTAGLASQAAEASQAAKNLATAGGRGAALRAQARGPYTAGMSAMDSALTGAALGTRGTDLAALYGGLSQQLVDARVASDAQIAAAQAASQQAGKQYSADAMDWAQQGEQMAAQQQVPEMLAAPVAPPEEPLKPKARHWWENLPGARKTGRG